MCGIVGQALSLQQDDNEVILQIWKKGISDAVANMKAHLKPLAYHLYQHDCIVSLVPVQVSAAKASMAGGMLQYAPSGQALDGGNFSAFIMTAMLDLQVLSCKQPPA